MACSKRRKDPEQGDSTENAPTLMGKAVGMNFAISMPKNIGVVEARSMNESPIEAHRFPWGTLSRV